MKKVLLGVRRDTKLIHDTCLASPADSSRSLNVSAKMSKALNSSPLYTLKVLSLLRKH